MSFCARHVRPQEQQVDRPCLRLDSRWSGDLEQGLADVAQGVRVGGVPAVHSRDSHPREVASEVVDPTQLEEGR